MCAPVMRFHIRDSSSSRDTATAADEYLGLVRPSCRLGGWGLIGRPRHALLAVPAHGTIVSGGVAVDALQRVLWHLDLDELEALREVGAGLRPVTGVAALDGRVVRAFKFGLVLIQGRLVEWVQEAALERLQCWRARRTGD